MKVVILLLALSVTGMAKDLRVMSFNIRYGTAPDGINSWENRRDILIDTIDSFQPHVIGVQEALQFQLEHIHASRPHYRFHRVIWNAILYDTRHFQLQDSGELWLSETPLVPESRSWSARSPRVLTWVKLLRVDHSKQPVYVFNTHLDVDSVLAREFAAKMIRQHIQQICPDGAQVVLTGDFNTARASAPWYTLTQPAPGPAGAGSGLLDAWATAAARPDDSICTYHHFQGLQMESAWSWWLGLHAWFRFSTMRVAWWPFSSTELSVGLSDDPKSTLHAVGSHLHALVHAWLYDRPWPFVSGAASDYPSSLLDAASTIVGGALRSLFNLVQLIFSALFAAVQWPWASLGIAKNGTFHIDWILYQNLPAPSSFSVIRFHRPESKATGSGALFPSDHFPIGVIFPLPDD